MKNVLIIFPFFLLYHSSFCKDFFSGSWAIQNVSNSINATINNDTIFLSSSCKNAWSSTLQPSSKEILFKIADLTSWVRTNDISNSEKCLTNNNYELDMNMTFLIIEMNNQGKYLPGDIRFPESKKIVGACFIDGCNKEEYLDIFWSLSLHLELFEEFKKEQIIIYTLDKVKPDFSFKIFLKMLPEIILFLIAICSVFNILLKLLFKRYFFCVVDIDKVGTEQTPKDENQIFKNEKHNNEEISSQRDFYIIKKLRFNYKSYKAFMSCFSLRENIEFRTTDNSSYNNPSGLSVISGFRSICIIFLGLGQTFLYLHYAPVKLFNEKAYVMFIKGTFFSVVCFLWRLSCRLLFSVSGYSLVYKLLCYLDAQHEDESHLLINRNTQITEEFLNTQKRKDTNPDDQTKTIATDFLRNFSNYKSASASKVIAKYVKWRCLIYFYGIQIYKYFLFLILVLYYKYTFYDGWDQISFNSSTPLWFYLKVAIIDKFTIKYFFATIFMISTYSAELNYLYDHYTIIYNEFFTFCFGSLLIFLFYKKNWRLDIFLLSYLLVANFLKIIFITYLCNHDIFFPAFSFQPQKYDFIQDNPLYNSTGVTFGFFFGMVNYCLQKSISYSTIVSERKRYLLIPLAILNFFQRIGDKNKIFLAFFSLAVVVFMSLSHFVLISTIVSESDPYFSDFYKNYGLNLFATCKLDITMFFLFTFLLLIILLGDNFMVRFLSNDLWGYLSRPYFTWILLQNLIIIYVLYQFNSLFKLDGVNIFLVYLMSFGLNLVICPVFHVLVEMPLKKLNKFLFKKEESKEDL
jgi:hypothetical protein